MRRWHRGLHLRPRACALWRRGTLPRRGDAAARRHGAGGGGGGDGSGSTAGIGGTGGGGNGGSSEACTIGTANTGSGAGGGGYPSTTGCAAGSGVVILRMTTAQYSGTTSGSPTVTTDGADTILVYNASGSYTA